MAHVVEGSANYHRTVWNTGERDDGQVNKAGQVRQHVAAILRDTEMRPMSDSEVTFSSRRNRGHKHYDFDYADDDYDDELELEPTARKSKKPKRNAFFKHLRQLQQAKLSGGGGGSTATAAAVRMSQRSSGLGDGPGTMSNDPDLVTSNAVRLGKSCLPTDGLELSMDSEDEEPILDLVSPKATSHPGASATSLSTLVESKAFKRKRVLKYVATASAIAFVIFLLTFFILLAVRLLSS